MNWTACQCVTGHTDRNGNRTDCAVMFRQEGARWKDCFLCWVKKNPAPVSNCPSCNLVRSRA